jgi:hypothetical protein
MLDFGWAFLFVLAVFAVPLLLVAGVFVLLLFGSVMAEQFPKQARVARPAAKTEFCECYHGAAHGVSLIVTAKRLRHPIDAPGGGTLVWHEIEGGDKRVRLWNKSQRGN